MRDHHAPRVLVRLSALLFLTVVSGCGEQAARHDTGRVFTGGIEAVDSVLAANRGKWVLLNVWATWCRPCVAETPDLVAFANSMAGRPFTTFGISTDYFTDDDTTAIRKVSEFQIKHSVPYPNLVFIGGVDALTERLQLAGALPTTILFDPQGNSVEHSAGKLERGQLDVIRERVG